MAGGAANTGEGVAMLAGLARQSPTAVLVLLVWWTLRDMAADLDDMRAGIAVLVERGR